MFQLKKKQQATHPSILIIHFKMKKSHCPAPIDFSQHQHIDSFIHSFIQQETAEMNTTDVVASWIKTFQMIGLPKVARSEVCSRELVMTTVMVLFMTMMIKNDDDRAF